LIGRPSDAYAENGNGNLLLSQAGKLPEAPHIAVVHSAATNLRLGSFLGSLILTPPFSRHGPSYVADMLNLTA